MSDDQRFVLHPDEPSKGWPVWANFTAALREEVRRLFPDGRAVELVFREKRKGRSLAQNRLYWWWLRHIRDHINTSQGAAFSDEDLHEWFKERFLDSRIIEVDATPVRARKSTTKLNVQQMTEYLENIDWFANERLGLVLPHPEDLYREAMGHDRAA